MTRIFNRSAFAFCTVAAVACSDGEASLARSEQPAESADAGPLYAIQSMIFDDTQRTSYVTLLPTLDRDEDVKLSDAREFPEYSPADAVGGQVLVGSGEDPSVTSYAISASGEWQKGQTISFADYTSEPLAANHAVSDTEIYVPMNTTSFVRWNPETFEILGEIAAPDALPQQAEGEPELNVARGFGHALRDGKFFQPYYWSEPNHFAGYSKISVIDTNSDEVTDVLEVPCPHLHIVNEDDEGNIWLSNGQGSIAGAVVDKAHARNGFVRIPAGSSEVDEDSITYFKDLTDGREGSNLLTVSEDLAIFNVYHAERDNFGDDIDFDAVDRSENYHLWTYDMKTRKAAIMEGIDYMGGQIGRFRIDDTVLLTVPARDYGSTSIYEVLPEGRAEKRFEVEGWAFKMFRVR